jgi:hypothetical protein
VIVPDRDWWGDTRVVLPDGEAGWDAVVGPELAVNGAVQLTDALPLVPVGVWSLRGSG